MEIRVKKLSETLAKEETSRLSATQAKRVGRTIAETYEKLRQFVEDLDPIKRPQFVFEPSNPNVAGRVAGVALVPSRQARFGAKTSALAFGRERD